MAIGDQTIEAELRGILGGLPPSASGTDFFGELFNNPDSTELLAIYNNGIAEVVDRILMIKPTDAFLFSGSTNLTDANGISIEGNVLNVTRNEFDTTNVYMERVAEEINPASKGIVTDPNSLQYRSKSFPVWYKENGKVFVLPVPTISEFAIIQTVKYGSLASVNTVNVNETTNFPSKYVNIILKSE